MICDGEAILLFISGGLGFNSLRAMDSISGLEVTMRGGRGGGGASLGKSTGPCLKKIKNNLLLIQSGNSLVGGFRGQQFKSLYRYVLMILISTLRST